MEYGAIPKITQFVDNNSLELQRVQSSKESSEIKNKDNHYQLLAIIH